ncbi:hypothetical protein [Paenibacillus harenae]|uniref:Uncharacterized protein n=1 Tax=Paenibacillus harenae TaxID=306543 RepID=A0ABT9TYT4_PAEHA|nr:hypothetical protein [Paenibacillus harenae]MDQ0112535.1 hypothetical protein [Paenibacillus harenae]
MDTKELEFFAEKHKCFERAVDGFWIYVNSWLEEEPAEVEEGFETLDLTSVVLSKKKIALVVNYSFDEPIRFVTTTMNVSLDKVVIAEYYFVLNLDGNGIDDSLSFHPRPKIEDRI